MTEDEMVGYHHRLAQHKFEHEQRYTVHRLRKKNLLLAEKKGTRPIEISYLN